MDTTSSALAHVLHLLAEHPDIQDKLRREITEAHQRDVNFSFDELAAFPYLDAVIRETLRL